MLTKLRANGMILELWHMTELSLFCGRKIAVFVHEKKTSTVIRITGLLCLLKQYENGLAEFAMWDIIHQVAIIRAVYTVSRIWSCQKIHQLSSSSWAHHLLPRPFVVNLLCTAELDVLALFVFVCVHTGTGTVKSSPGEALKDRQCLFTFASIYYEVCHMLCVFLFSSMQPV